MGVFAIGDMMSGGLRGGFSLGRMRGFEGGEGTPSVTSALPAKRE